MAWETPSFIEIDMSSEIGSYQEEDEPGRRDDFFGRAQRPAAPHPGMTGMTGMTGPTGPTANSAG